MGNEIRQRDALIEIGYARAVVADGWKYIATRIPSAIIEKSKGRALADLTPSGDFDVRGQADKFPHHNEPDQLYDLTADPFEQHNLCHEPDQAARLADVRERLKRLLEPLPHPFAEFSSKK